MTELRKKSLGRYLLQAFLYFHIFIFIGINTLLIITNYLISPQTPWFIFPLSFWSMILLGHFITYFFLESDSARKWREIHEATLVTHASELGLTQTEIRKKAATRLFFIMAFYFHLSVYLGSSFIMLIINYLVNPQIKWSLIVIASWGLWVLINALMTYLCFSAALEDWRIKKIKSFTYQVNVPGKNKPVQREGIILFGFWLAFRIHVLLYSLTNLFLFILDILHNQNTAHWFYYPLLGWGIMLLAHWLLTYLITSPRLAVWREDKANQPF